MGLADNCGQALLTVPDEREREGSVSVTPDRVAPTFHSILSPGAGPGPAAESAPAPAFFRDLHLDQIVASATSGREDYNLVPFFHDPLADADAIAYRHEVFRDLEDAATAECVRAFGGAMRRVREHLELARKLHYQQAIERWRLDAILAYCDAVESLAEGLAEAAPRSRALTGLRARLLDHVSSQSFSSLAAEGRKLLDDLSGISYSLEIKGSRIKVRRYDDEPDYSEQVAATFAKFRQAGVKDYRVRFPSSVYMNHVEGGILERVARLFPDIFQALSDYCRRNQDFIDATIARFDREAQFYLAWIERMDALRARGLSFCYPRVSAEFKAVRARDTFDLALAGKLAAEGATVVRNDFHLEGPERILVVTGPNQGGKTTLARTFGQLHYLAKLGCPVPGASAELYLCDEIFTHFEREEHTGDLTGKLADELVRVRDILAGATPRSVVIVNEIFTSTTLSDAVFLAREIMSRLIDLDALGVCVTFLDELASLAPATVSMVSTVVPEDPAQRTFKVVRRPADGLAYAMAIATKHGLTYEQLKGRAAR